MYLKEIQEAIRKGGEFIVEHQREDGSWRSLHYFPRLINFAHPIVRTVQGFEALCVLENEEYLPNIAKALNFCLEYPLDQKADDLVAWAWKLRALKYIHTIKAMVERKKIIQLLENRQEKSGSWMVFPKSNIVNSYILIGGYVDFPQHIKSKFIHWLLKSKAEDGIGWGPLEKDFKSHPLSTAVVIITLTLSGIKIPVEGFENARKFIEDSQLENGGWESYITKKASVWATSMAIESLFCFKKSSKNVIKQGVEFLLSKQNKDKGWPGGSDKSEVYSTFYAMHMLKSYQLIKEKCEDFKEQLIRKSFPLPLEYIRFNFFLKRRDVPKELVIKSILHSNILGNTFEVIERRKEIIRILSEEGQKEIAEIIDCLKRISKYKHYTKKAHMTKITYDLEHLRKLNIINKIGRKYFLIVDILKV